MNRSGEPVRDLLAERSIPPDAMLVVVDDTALPSGRLRFRAAGGAGGHRGLTSIEQALGTSAYPRLRVGIGEPPEGIDMADFVLEPLAGEAWSTVEAATLRAAEAVAVAVIRGLRVAMDACNPGPPAAGEPSPSAAESPERRQTGRPGTSGGLPTPS